jgi:cation diffusion facilitator family transporter
MRAAYVHVLTDALTSVLAIVALAFGWLYGWNQLDAVVGVLGAIVIGVWAIGLMRSAGSILLDVVPSDAMTRAITGLLEKGTDRVTDLHVWRLGPGHAGVIASVISDDPQPPEVYKQRLAGVPGLSHVTIEVQRCRHATSGSGPC